MYYEHDLLLLVDMRDDKNHYMLGRILRITKRYFVIRVMNSKFDLFKYSQRYYSDLYLTKSKLYESCTHNFKHTALRDITKEIIMDVIPEEYI